MKGEGQGSLEEVIRLIGFPHGMRDMESPGEGRGVLWEKEGKRGCLCCFFLAIWDIGASI